MFAIARTNFACRPVGRDHEIAVGELVQPVDLPPEFDRDAKIRTMLAQRPQQIDPRHPMEGIVGKRNRKRAAKSSCLVRFG